MWGFSIYQRLTRRFDVCKGKQPYWFHFQCRTIFKAGDRHLPDHQGVLQWVSSLITLLSKSWFAHSICKVNPTKSTTVTQHARFFDQLAHSQLTYVQHVMGKILVVSQPILQYPSYPLVIKHGKLENPGTQWRLTARKIVDFYGPFSSTPAMFDYPRVHHTS